jgi:hypothetical protein
VTVTFTLRSFGGYRVTLKQDLGSNSISTFAASENYRFEEAGWAIPTVEEASSSKCYP